jgi:hypothetical protein
MILPEHLSIQRSSSYLPLPVVLWGEGDWEGGQIVRELASPLGRYLFSTLRDVMHWLILPPEQRPFAFASGAIGLRLGELARAAAPLELSHHLTNLLRICSGEIEEADVCRACLGVAAWARGEGALHTELAFRQAGALSQPLEPALSLVTARLARDLCEHQRAETWFRRSIKLARAQKNWTVYIRAYLGLGAMYSRLGNGPAARAVTERALLAATRWRLRQLAGEAHHDLFHIWADAGDLRQAYDHVEHAENCYRGGSNQLLARLAGDIATLWVKVGAARRALPVFETVIPLTDDRGLRAMWSAQLVRCVALAQMMSSYATLRAGAITAISESQDLWRRAEATLIIAWADLAMGAWDKAEETAITALSVATSIGATEVISYAETAVADAKAHRREGAIVDSIEPPGLSRMADRIAGSIREAVTSKNTRVRKRLADAG